MSVFTRLHSIPRFRTQHTHSTATTSRQPIGKKFTSHLRSWMYIKRLSEKKA
jgi:hypothetical protein